MAEIQAKHEFIKSNILEISLTLHTSKTCLIPPDPKNIPDSMICPDSLSIRDISDFKAPPMEILKRKKPVEPHYKLMLKKSLKDEQKRLQHFQKVSIFLFLQACRKWIV